MTYPDDPAEFIIQLQNLDTNFSAPGLNVKVNLSVYTLTTHNVNFSLILPPNMYPIENSTYIEGGFTGVNFTLVDTILYFGQGITLTGFLNTSKGSIVIYYKWTLIIDDEIFYESTIGIISVYNVYMSFMNLQSESVE